jgi:hypothetical protein
VKELAKRNQVSARLFVFLFLLPNERSARSGREKKVFHKFLLL